MRLDTEIFVFASVLLSAAEGCSGTSRGADARTDADASIDVSAVADAACEVTIAEYREESQAIHVAPSTPIPWLTNPPSSGMHFPAWARWGIRTDTVPRGNWVHNLEHGGVAVLYRCDGNCESVRTALTALVQSLPAESACAGTSVTRRVVLTQDPLLDVPVAAASWGWTYRASCVDSDSLKRFVLDHTGNAPEDFCADGSY